MTYTYLWPLYEYRKRIMEIILFTVNSKLHWNKTNSGGLKEKVPHRLRHLKTWSLIDSAIYTGLGNLALMEEVCLWEQPFSFKSPDSFTV